MANIINQKNCADDYGNTGHGACFNDIGIWRATIYVDPTQEFSAVDVATLKTGIEAAILNDAPSKRAYPLQGIHTVTPAGDTVAADITFPATGEIVKAAFEPYYNISVQWQDGAFCVHHSLRKSNRQTRAFFVVDSLGQLIATKGSTADTIKGIKGYSYTQPFGWSVDASNLTKYVTSLSFAPSQVNEDIAIIDFTNDGGLGYLTGLTGLQNVVMHQTAAKALGVTHVGATTDCGNVDLHAIFATALEDLTAFRARNKTTLKPIAVTAVADDPSNNGWTVTVDTADPNYSAALVEISLNGPTELAALDVVGYESDYVLTTP